MLWLEQRDVPKVR